MAIAPQSTYESGPPTTRRPENHHNERILEVVRGYWGYDSLRPLQFEAIRAGIDRRDSLVVMPTGGGKSLCYQVPPVLEKRTDIVVSPLISLMKDQVDGLKACGYPAVALYSGLSEAERSAIYRDATAGQYRLIFAAPERIVTEGFLRWIGQLNVRSIAIDEAHCISHWGHDFRPEYRRLVEIKHRFPAASFHAYTATATERVRHDIIQQLRLVDPTVLVGNFDRPNLTYRVILRDDVQGQTLEVIRRHRDEAVIVYCISRKDTESMANYLQSEGVKAAYYHAGMSPLARRKAQDAFANEEVDVVVATVAFGMGIDRSNVRCVIHAAMPKSIEHYQQETGRAGRDGLDAECVMLYSPGDLHKWKRLLSDDTSTPEGQRNYESQIELLHHLQAYCQPFDCRHRRLVEYFGQVYRASDCGACDVCLHEAGDTEDVTILAQKILSCVARTKERFGARHVASVLRGSDNEMIRKWNHESLSTFGLVQDMTIRQLTATINQMADLGLLTRSNDSYATLKLNEESWRVMRGERSVRLPIAHLPVTRDEKREASWIGVDRGLFDALRALRKQIADERSAPPFVIFSDASLRDMARRRPKSIDEFGSINGVGKTKLDDFGDRFLDCITKYCQSNKLASNMSAPPPAVHSVKARALTPVVLKARELFRTGVSVDHVADEVARSRGTVVNYLMDFIEAERPATITAWISETDYERIAAVVGELGTERLRPVFEALGGTVSYDDIRIVGAHISALADAESGE